MNKVLKYILNVLILAWNGALIIFTGTVLTTGLFEFVDKFLDNHLAGSCILAVVLILVTIVVGAKLDERMEK